MGHHSPPPGIQAPLPTRIPLFPLRGALLLPGGDLPLNIFEARYCAMLEWAMRTDRMIGMIQPKTHQNDLYPIGCAGRVTQYQETDDGRYLITLRGISRFRLTDTPQLTSEHYLLANIDYTPFESDLTPPCEPPQHLCRSGVKDMLDSFLAREQLSVDWEQAACISDAKFYTLLAMVVPFDPCEKQALLEAADVPERCRMLVQMLEMALAKTDTDDKTPSVFH